MWLFGGAWRTVLVASSTLVTEASLKEYSTPRWHKQVFTKIMFIFYTCKNTHMIKSLPWFLAGYANTFVVVQSRALCFVKLFHKNHLCYKWKVILHWCESAKLEDRRWNTDPGGVGCSRASWLGLVGNLLSWCPVSHHQCWLCQFWSHHKTMTIGSRFLCF